MTRRKLLALIPVALLATKLPLSNAERRAMIAKIEYPAPNVIRFPAQYFTHEDVCRLMGVAA